MTKNLIPKIAQMLGVELEEEFKVKYNTGYIIPMKFKLTEKGLFYCVKSPWEIVPSNLLEMLLTGACSIIKLPFKPKMGEMYSSLCLFKNSTPYVKAYMWQNITFDFALLKLGMVYRTKEECEAHFQEDYKKLTGMEVEK